MKDSIVTGSALNDALTEYFARSCKPYGEGKVGVESEHFVINKKTGLAAGYAGSSGVEELLKRLVSLTPGSRQVSSSDGCHTLGYETEDYTITLEPAAQLEISIVPRDDVNELGRIYNSFREIADGVLSDMGLELLTVGCLPHGSVRDLTLIPKKRYAYMDEYFRNTGDGGIEMMRGTASTQVSIDYSSEEDFRRKLQAASLLTPVLQMMYDNSLMFQDVPLTGHLKRADIWRRTDRDRCGMIPGVFSLTFGFEDYAAYLCGMPLILRQRGEETEYVGFLTADEVYAGCEIREEDLLHVMSMVFPDVRVKGYLEIRGVDSLPEPRMLSYCRLIKKIFYSSEGLDFCQSFIREKHITEKDVYEAQDSLMKHGWDCRIYGLDAVEFRDRVFSGA